jgi:uncharacterized protein YeaO (DUF488 family)
MTMTALRIKRAYEPHEKSDGCRVLVDRLWPRGLSKAAAAIDHWFKEVAPSADLRRWFDHRADRWAEFQTLYRAELNGEPQRALLNELAAIAAAGPTTLVYSARDEQHNQAIVLAAVLRKRLDIDGD